MATLREEYFQVPDTFVEIFGSIRKAQSVLITGSYPVGDVAIYGDAAEDEGDLMIEVRSNNGSNQPGVLLGSGSVSKAQVRIESEGWHLVSITTPFNVSPGDIVHIVAYVTAGTMYWRMRQAEPTYPIGGVCTSSDNGESWMGPVEAIDRFFQVWEYIPPVQPPLVELSDPQHVVGLRILPSRSFLLSSFSLMLRRQGTPGNINLSIRGHGSFFGPVYSNFNICQILTVSPGQEVHSSLFNPSGLTTEFTPFVITVDPPIEVKERHFFYFLFSCGSASSVNKVQFSKSADSRMYERILESVDSGLHFTHEFSIIPYVLYGDHGYEYDPSAPR